MLGARFLRSYWEALGKGMDMMVIPNRRRVVAVISALALAATLAALAAVALVATSGTAVGQQRQAPTQPLYEVHDLGELPGGPFSYAFGINEAAKVVGAAFSRGTLRALPGLSTTTTR